MLENEKENLLSMCLPKTQMMLQIMCIVNQYFMKKLLYGATSGEYIENTIAVGIGGKDSVLE